MDRTHPTSRRRGVGVVLGVILFLCIMMLGYVLMLSTRSRGVTALVQRSVQNDHCEIYARMAAREAVRVLRTHAADPDHPAFAFLRGPAGATLEFGAGELPRTSREVGFLSGYALGAVEATLLRKASVGADARTRNEFETLGVVRVTGEATGPRGSRAVLTTEYGLRTALAVPPRPFDAPTVLILDPAAILGNSNEIITNGIALVPPIQDALRRLAGTLTSKVPDWGAVAGKVDAALAQAVADARKEADDEIDRRCNRPFCDPDDKRREAYAKIDQYAAAYRQAVDPFVQHAQRAAAAYGSMAGRIEAAASGMQAPPEPHLFANGTSLMSLADSVDLGAWNLPRLVDPRATAVDESKDDLEAALRDFQATYASHFAALAPVDAAIQAAEYPDLPQVDVGPLDAALSSLESGTTPIESTRLAVLVGELMQTFIDFQGRVIELGGDPQRQWFDVLARLSAVEMARKAHFTFAGGNALADLARFLTRRGPRSGVVYVDHPGPVEIDVTDLKGRLLIATSSDAIVRNASVADPDRDSLTIVSYGNLEAAGGGVQAGLLAVGKGFSPPGGGWTGSLVLNTLRGGDLDAVLRGTVRAQPALLTSDRGNGGPRPPPEGDRVVALLSPAHLYRRLDR